MKKTLFSNFLLLFIVSTFYLPNTFAEDATQWNLPENAKARLGKGEIREMQYSADGKFLAVATDIGIWLYDTTTYQEVALLTAHTKAVKCLAFSPDGKILASGSDDNTIRLWSVDTGETQMILTGHTHEFEGVKSVTFSPDGKTLVSGGGDNIIHLWDIDTGEINMTLVGHTHWVFSLAFSPDGKTLASGGVDSVINLWDANTGEHKKTLDGHTAWVRSIAFSPDGKTLVSGSDDGTVLLWDLTTSVFNQ